MDDMVNTLAGFLFFVSMVIDSNKPARFWGSKVNSKTSSISSISNLENMKDTVAEETSYADSNTSEVDNTMDDATPKKTRTRTYVMRNKLKTISFNNLSNDNNNILTLPVPKFSGAKCLLSVKLCVINRQNFEPVKSFTLDIELSAVLGKTIKLSLKRARELAIHEKIVANNNIPINLLKLAVESVFSKFGKVVSIKMQLIGLWQKALVEFELFEIADLVDSVHVAKAINNKQSWISRDLHQALLYTLPIGMTAHDLSNLLKSYGKKTCFIGHNPSSYVCDRCVVVCFGDETSKLAVIGSILVFKGFDHISMECSLGENSGARVFFGNKTWAQVAGRSLSRVVSSVFSDAGVFSGGKPLSLVSSSPNVSGLSNCLAALECSLELLADQVSDILKRLNGVELVLLVPLFCVFLPAVFMPKVSVLILDMLADSMLASSDPLSSNVDVSDAGFGSSISKVLITKVGGLESKLLALDASVSIVLVRLDLLCSGAESGNMMFFVTETKLHSSIKSWIADRFNGICVFMLGLDKGFFDTEMAIIIDSFLARYVSKVEEISSWVISVWLLFKDKLSITFLGLYAVNSLIVRAVNSSTFVVLGGDFNENGSGKSASFKFCLGLNLVNLFVDSHLAGSPMWNNSRGIEKTIDYIFVSRNLLSAVADHKVASVSDFFDTDHKAVVVSVGLGGLLDVHLNSLHKQANRNSKIVKAFCSDDLPEIDYLVSRWSTLDDVKAHVFDVLFCSDVKSEVIIKHLSLVYKNYRRLKMFKLRLAEEVSIKKVIERCMENFCLDKSSMIKSVLDKLFHKMVLDHLVVDNKLILEPKEYASLDYVRDDAFSGVMCVVNMDKLLLVVFSLPDSKTAGLSDIPNKLWKHSVSTQYTLNIANEFFEVNDISINSEKTVAIPINQGVKVASLSICGQPILIAKKNKTHHYLDIFLSTEGLSKPSVAKAHTDVRFFVNIVLRKVIMDKQFLYLVSAVLQPIVSYCLKSKACFFHDFPDAALHHPSLYSLKPFEQMQSEGKMAALIMFSNAPVGLVKIFLDNELSLVNNFPTVFHNPGHFLLFSILGKSLYFNSVKSLKCFGVVFGNWLFDKKDGLLDWKTFCHWKRLDPCGLVPHWFVVVSEFFLGKRFSLSGTTGSVELHRLDVLGSSKFSAIKNELHNVWLDFFEVYTDGSLKNAGSAEIAGSAATYFPALNLSVGVAIRGFLSSTMAELQAVALSLECVPFSSTVVLYLDSQAAINACVSEMSFATPNFCNQCWFERHHIFNLVRDKDLNVSWAKIKGHFEIPSNVKADLAVGAVFGSPFLLSANMHEHFLVVENTAVFGNACHFVWNIFQSVCYAHWEAGSGCNLVPNVMSQVFNTSFLYDKSCAQEITSGGQEEAV
ncbi:hypothetical protein G9A89_011939 [Geosiphon pyriformis]|nr:hypothetical protein G9A89_011939 [Geosiphon pyriformis]